MGWDGMANPPKLMPPSLASHRAASLICSIQTGMISAVQLETAPLAEEPTLPGGNTRSVLTAPPSSSSRSTAEATAGPAASRCWSGSSDPRTTASMLRVRCGRSLRSTRFSKGRPTTEGRAGSAAEGGSS